MNQVAVVIATEALVRMFDKLMEMGIDKSDCLVAMFTMCGGMSSGIALGDTSIARGQGLTAETYYDHSTQLALAMIYTKLKEAFDVLIPLSVREEEAKMPRPFE